MYTYGRRAALIKLGFMGAPLSALAKQHLMSAGAGAAGGALLGGEGNRMSGAMGGAALGLAGSHAAGPTELLGRANRAAGEYHPGGMKPIQRTEFPAREAGPMSSAPPPPKERAGRASREQAQTPMAPPERVGRGSIEIAPHGRTPTMAPIKRTTYNTAEAGETAPFGYGANSLPPGAGSMMPPSVGALSSQMTLPPGAGSMMPPSVGAPSVAAAAPAGKPARPTPPVDRASGVRPVQNADPFAEMMPPSLPPPSLPKPGLMPTMDRRMAPAAPRHSDPALSYSDWASAPPPSMAAPKPQGAWHSVAPSRYRDTLQSPPPMHG